MANGYSPDYPGAVNLKEGEKWVNTYCKIQLSSVVAQKLLTSMKKYQPENTDKVQSVE